ncbi:hypothetical protein SORBI_3003G073540 [Sorghum bicolor]|uniref:Uncharacterized protein n=1 Tax=Sorghum bicolor TaxID=4558 RepID=A0A1W0VW09_SORBI|nr:hypothetical protein SORBI_3003G073540 [Sorghum bicolor]
MSVSNGTTGTERASEGGRRATSQGEPNDRRGHAPSDHAIKITLIGASTVDLGVGDRAWRPRTRETIRYREIRSRRRQAEGFMHVSSRGMGIFLLYMSFDLV